MPKDPARNIDRYKIRGGQFNEFDFNRQQHELSQEEDSQSERGAGFQIPSAQSKAERVKRLLAKYGESVPGEQKRKPRSKSTRPAKSAKASKTIKASKTAKASKQGTPRAKSSVKATARSTKKAAARTTSQKGARKVAPRRSTKKSRTITRGSSKKA